MPAKKIQDEAEVVRWFEEGRTYEWMAQEYVRKYNIETVPSMWGNFRRRRGLTRRIVQDDQLIPWAVDAEHRRLHAIVMLRAAARLRQGVELEPAVLESLNSWLRSREEANEVVHYEAGFGFSYVRRREGVDLDLIREPEVATKQRLNADRHD
jgi:hypothetical protein